MATLHSLVFCSHYETRALLQLSEHVHESDWRKNTKKLVLSWRTLPSVP